jgi:hypothetical protein
MIQQLINLNQMHYAKEIRAGNDVPPNQYDDIERFYFRGSSNKIMDLRASPNGGYYVCLFRKTDQRSRDYKANNRNNIALDLTAAYVGFNLPTNAIFIGGGSQDYPYFEILPQDYNAFVVAISQLIP